MAIRDDLLPVDSNPAAGARIQMTNRLDTTPQTVNGPTFTANFNTGRLTMAGKEIGNTGWRNITADTTVTEGTVYLKRTDDTVILLLSFVKFATVPEFFWTPPDGYKGSATSSGYFAYNIQALPTSGADRYYLYRLAGTGNQWQVLTAPGSTLDLNDTHGVEIRYETADGWPAEPLPGTAA